MTNFNFKRQATVHLIYNDNKYTLEVGPELSFSQTFTEDTTPVKTLHSSEDYFERSVIQKANPANFSFKIPTFNVADLKVVHDRLLDCKTFDLYISTEQDVFKLEKAVITNGTYGIERSTPLTLTVDGQASKLSKVASVPSTGTTHNPSAGRQHIATEQVSVILGGTDISSEVLSLSVELQNELRWTENKNVHSTLSITDRSNAVFPEGFTITKKVLAGSIGKYITDDNADDLLDFTTSTSLRIRVGKDPLVSYNHRGFDFNLAGCSFTNRSQAGEVFTQHYDWRLASNQNPVSSLISYKTTTT